MNEPLVMAASSLRSSAALVTARTVEVSGEVSGTAGGAGGTGRTGGFVALTAAGREAEAVLSPAAHCTHDLAECEAEYVAHRDGAER